MEPPESEEAASLIKEVLAEGGSFRDAGVRALELELERGQPPRSSSPSRVRRGGLGLGVGAGKRRQTPKPEAEEAASLIEEVLADGGSFQDAAARVLKLEQEGAGRLTQKPKGGGAAQGGSLSGFLSRYSILLLILSGFVAVLVLVANRADNAIEVDAATTTRGILHHFASGSSPKSSKESNKISDHDDSNGDTGKDDSATDYIGFHEASLENLYGANHYYKPKGLGYSRAPQGGLHPIYMNEIGADRQKEILDERERGYFNDDYEFSPYADERLKMTDEERKTEQSEWSKKLEEIRDKYGYWGFRDDYRTKNGKDRPVVNWAEISEKRGDIDKDDFPKGSWQADDEYVAKFIKEGKRLVKRVVDGISDEYGWENPGERGGISIPDANEKMKTVGGASALAWMYRDAFDGLVRKLLFAMMTNDHFYVTLGGHSAAAGHGNNFLQSYMMEFQRVMEPVFDRLGMVLVSANRAQGGMGTIQTALAGKSIYGETDLMLWDSSMTEKDTRAQDIFMRQALLAGELHVPILFDMGGGKGTMEKLRKEVGALIGGVQANAILPKFRQTTIDFDEKKFNAKCWTDRTDVAPPAAQNSGYGGQASWHPGNWVHQSTARKLSLVFLHAMDEALTVWETAAAGRGNPLDGVHWHLREQDEGIREKLRKADASSTDCGVILDFAPRVCTTPMRGAGEWTPRNDPDRSSIRSLVKAAPSGYVPGLIDGREMLYLGREVHIPSQRVPEGEVDVATIARSLAPKDEEKRRGLFTTWNPSSKLNTTAVRQGPQRHRPASRMLSEGSIIVPGEGWTVENHPPGFCDGTSNSVCNRAKDFNCLLSGHNDGRGTVKGDALSGWLVLELIDVSEGLFLARMEPWQQYNSNKRTEGWESVNDGRNDSGSATGASPSKAKDLPKPTEEAVEPPKEMPAQQPEASKNARPEDSTNVPENSDADEGGAKGDVDLCWDCIWNMRLTCAARVNYLIDRHGVDKAGAIDSTWKNFPQCRAEKGRRRLKAPPPPLPDSFLFEVALDGNVIHSWNSTEFHANCHYIGYNVVICVLWDDEEWARENEKRVVEFAFRVGGEDGRKSIMGLTHIYYA